MRAFCVFALLLGCSGESTVVPACDWLPVASASYDLTTDCRWSMQSLDVERVRLSSLDGECVGLGACGCELVTGLRPHELVTVWSAMPSGAALGLTLTEPCD